MRDAFAARVRDGSLTLLPPERLVELPAFVRVRRSPAEYAENLRAVQQLRGRVYVDDGALTPSALASDGRHVSPLDGESWHLVVRDDGGAPCGCIRLTLHPRPVDIERLNVMHKGWTRLHPWGWQVRPAVEALIGQADADGIGFAETGGWALAADARDSAGALLMLVGTYALYRLLGDVRAVSTATVRNNSAGMLLRFGAERLALGGIATPEYDDEEFGCRMQLLSFDSRRVNPRFEPMVAHATRALAAIDVVMGGASGIEAASALHIECPVPAGAREACA